MVPHVVSEEDLVSANALNGQNRQVARLIGSAIGGVLAATGGIVLVAVFDVVSYLAAAGLTMMIKHRRARDGGRGSRRRAVGVGRANSGSTASGCASASPTCGRS